MPVLMAAYIGLDKDQIPHSSVLTRTTQQVGASFGTAVLAVILGTLAAYAFSRFRIRGESDMLFFILSTRMLPPIVVLIPIFLMFTYVNLRESYTKHVRSNPLLVRDNRREEGTCCRTPVLEPYEPPKR